MEAKAKQANWVVPILIATMTVLTLIALVSWVQVVFGGVMPGAAPFGGTGGMMGSGGMMMNTANTGPAGAAPDISAHMKAMMGSGDMLKNCSNCAKTMGSNSGNIQQQMQQHMQQMNNTATDKTL